MLEHALRDYKRDDSAWQKILCNAFSQTFTYFNVPIMFVCDKAKEDKITSLRALHKIAADCNARIFDHLKKSGVEAVSERTLVEGVLRGNSTGPWLAKICGKLGREIKLSIDGKDHTIKTRHCYRFAVGIEFGLGTTTYF